MKGGRGDEKYLRLAFGTEVSSETHGQRSGNELSEASIDNDLGVSESRQASGQGKRNGEAIRESDSSIRDDARIDLALGFTTAATLRV